METKAFYFADKKEWESCFDCLGLLVFGVILFLWTLDYIDPIAISVFWGAKALNADPTLALLVDIYYALDIQYGKGRGTLNCCIPLLYSWVMTHLYKEDYMVPNITKIKAIKGKLSKRA